MPEKNGLQSLLPFTEKLEVTANKVKRVMFKGGDKTGYVLEVSAQSLADTNTHPWVPEV